MATTKNIRKTSASKARQKPKAGKATPKRRPVSAAETAKKLSALAAAARVLSESGQSMTCQELIAAMAVKGYWTSPAGKTPAATLYAALTREIQTKKEASRFQKTERGKFALA
ncbi:MAG TPA: HTH domain-containing protein [Gemmataceae bacterium]|nr:HTH domain-containing protein [Gemmataceae bacterium]